MSIALESVGCPAAGKAYFKTGSRGSKQPIVSLPVPELRISLRQNAAGGGGVDLLPLPIAQTLILHKCRHAETCRQAYSEKHKVETGGSRRGLFVGARCSPLHNLGSE